MAKKDTNKEKNTAPLIPEEDRIIKTEYSELMQKSFIDYAMSVIVARALPDIRDGLKPVQRRVLYSMNELGIRSDRPHRKSARIVGDTMGKYHPHGDSSIYDSLVVMAQDFKKEVTLVDGHGNFGNIEGDSAAAMRYTEARLEKLTEDAFLADLDKDVVDFVPNFDETEKEPSVLPVRIPHFLINGSEGIAVGMTTSTPPHNLAEAIDAQIAYLDHPELTTRELMQYIKGPDFPTGGIVVNESDLEEIYETGTGKIRVRGRVETEKGRNGHIHLIITEIPYTMIGAGIGKFLSDVAALSENKVTSDIIDISNQSSKEGIRIVIELKKDTDVENFKNMLYKKTRLEDTFGVNMLAIADGRPETLGLKDILRCNADFQYQINTRKYTNLLEKERKKKEIQEGLIKAVDVIDLIIEILRGSRDRKMARACLVEGDITGIKFKYPESAMMAKGLSFTPAQADAILDMRLYRLIGLEIEALMKEYEETCANIYRYEDILESRRSMRAVIRKDLMAFKKKYARERRTEITQAQEAVFRIGSAEEDRELYFLMDRFSYAKTMEPSLTERNMEAVKESYTWYFRARSSGKVCIFTEAGQMHTVRMQDLPAKKLRDKGTPIDNVSNYKTETERTVFACSQETLLAGRFLFVTAKGMVKIVEGSDFEAARKTIAAARLQEEDRIAAILEVRDETALVLRTAGGIFLKFPLSEVPSQKKTAIGNHGIRLSGSDFVEAAYLIGEGHPGTVTADGQEVDIARMKMSKRDGKGTKKL